jgi:N-acetylglucosamine kinase-like BadF-type ATPase
VTRVLGIDGGQSGIRLRTSDDDRVVEVGGVSRQEGDPVEAVVAAVERGWREVGVEPVDRVVLGLTTAPSVAADADRLAVGVAGATGASEVWVADDAVTTHAGALGMGWGVSVVAGTGVACLALSVDGTPWIVGGHGFLLGDEGGGYWIGSRALGAVLRASEGRDEETGLSEAAVAMFGPLDGLAARLHDAPRSVDAIARFAPAVMAEARAGDEVARRILDEAVDQLERLAT